MFAACRLKRALRHLAIFAKHFRTLDEVIAFIEVEYWVHLFSTRVCLQHFASMFVFKAAIVKPESYARVKRPKHQLKRSLFAACHSQAARIRIIAHHWEGRVLQAKAAPLKFGPVVEGETKFEQVHAANICILEALH